MTRLYVARGSYPVSSQDVTDTLNLSAVTISQNWTFNSTTVTFNNNVILGSSSSDTLTINATSTFTASASFTGSLYQFTSATTLQISSSSVTFGATASVTFASGGGVTFAGSVTFSSSLVTFNNDVVLGSSAADDVVVNAVTVFNASVTMLDQVTMTGSLIQLGNASTDIARFFATPDFRQGTSPTAGGILGYILVQVGGTQRKLAYYAV